MVEAFTNALWDVRKAEVRVGSLGTSVVILRLGLIERAPSVSCLSEST